MNHLNNDNNKWYKFEIKNKYFDKTLKRTGKKLMLNYYKIQNVWK